MFASQINRGAKEVHVYITHGVLSGKAVEKIKQGKGPQFIEFSTYRWLEHCGPNYDNDIGYRTEQEFLFWKKKDPIEFCEKKILCLSIGQIDDYHKRTQKIVDNAFKYAIESPFPEPQEAYTNLYSD